LAKIGDLDLSVPLNENISRFQVAMNNVYLLGGWRADNNCWKSGRAFLWQGPLFIKQIIQDLPGQIPCKYSEILRFLPTSRTEATWG